MTESVVGQDPSQEGCLQEPASGLVVEDSVLLLISEGFHRKGGHMSFWGPQEAEPEPIVEITIRHIWAH